MVHGAGQIHPDHGLLLEERHGLCIGQAELAAQLGAKARDRVRSTYRFSEYADKIRSRAASLENSSVPEVAI